MLVNELQEIAESEDILTVLRKAKRVSSKLDRIDILDWIKNEMDGYIGTNTQKVPSYREVNHQLCFKTNGYIPAGFGQYKDGIFPVPNFSLGLPIYESIKSLQIIADSGQDGCFPADQELKNSLESNLSYEELNRCELLYRVSNIGIKNVIQSVRDMVLDWAIELERQGIVGEGHTFTLEEKQKAFMIKIDIGDNALIGAVGSGANGEVSVSEVKKK